MLFKHPFLNLNMGLVKENFVIAKKDDKNFWEARGFKIIRKYPIFRYKPTLLGIVTPVNATHSINASLPMAVTPSGITTLPPLPIYFCSFLFLITKSCSFILITVPFIKCKKTKKYNWRLLLRRCCVPSD